MSEEPKTLVTILVHGGAVITDRESGVSSYGARRVVKNIEIINREAHHKRWFIKNEMHYEILTPEQEAVWTRGTSEYSTFYEREP